MFSRGGGIPVSACEMVLSRWCFFFTRWCAHWGSYIMRGIWITVCANFPRQGYSGLVYDRLFISYLTIWQWVNFYLFFIIILYTNLNCCCFSTSNFIDEAKSGQQQHGTYMYLPIHMLLSSNAINDGQPSSFSLIKILQKLANLWKI